MSKNPFKTFFDEAAYVTHEFHETLVDVIPVDPEGALEAGSLEYPFYIFGTTGTGKTRTMDALLFEQIARGKNIGIIDLKASIYPLSRRKAKKRLMAAGLSPARANALIREIAGRAEQGHRLRGAMKHHRRHGDRWFPWDTCVR